MGIDGSVAMLRVAARKDAVAGRLARAACESLPFRGWDYSIWRSAHLLWGIFGILGLMVCELARVTSPGADLFVSDLHPDAYREDGGSAFATKADAVQIETVPRAAAEIVESFYSNGFECLGQTPLWLASRRSQFSCERGKLIRSRNACQLPAVLALPFR